MIHDGLEQVVGSLPRISPRKKAFARPPTSHFTSLRMPAPPQGQTGQLKQKEMIHGRLELPTFSVSRRGAC
jgi:hypothetical protein